MAPAVIEKLLRERPDGWFRDYDAMLLRALVDAVEEGKRIQGANVNDGSMASICGSKSTTRSCTRRCNAFR